MTILGVLSLYAGGGQNSEVSGRHISHGQFLQVTKPRKVTVPEKVGSDLKAYSEPTKNALLTRYTSIENVLLHIEHTNKRKAWCVLLSRQNGASKEIERKTELPKDVRLHMTQRFGIKFAA